MRAAFALVLLLACSACLSGTKPGAEPTPTAGIAPLFKAPVALSDNEPGAEPVIAVLTDGTIFVEGVGSNPSAARDTVNKVWRSRDDGATWTDVTPPALGEEGSFDGFLAAGNGDRVYAVNVAGTTFEIFRSDDKGDSWMPLEPPRLPVAMHRNWVVPVGEATLQVVMEALPPAFVVPGVSGTPNEGLWYLRSDDRGQTWTVPKQIDPIVNYAGQGNLAIDASGQRLYVPRYLDDSDPAKYESGHWYLIYSEDAGRTWGRREVFDLDSELASAVMPLAVDGAGTLYFAWSQLDNGTSRLFLSTSHDGGRTWGGRWPVAPGRGAQSMVWIDARATDELALVWYATDAQGSAVKVDAPWHVDFAWVTGAGGPEPTSHVARVTTKPVHEGNICAKGPACASGEDRRLLDYPWVDVGPDGRAHVVYASTQWDRPSAFAVYAGETLLFGR
jgi:BNR repeat protein